MRIPFGIILIGVSLFEIYLFIVVGGEIGAFTVIVLILASALIGLNVLRNQGFATMTRFRESVARGEPLQMVLVESFIALVGGLLLLAPGFSTDMLGLFCLWPFARRVFIIKYLLPYLKFSRSTRYRRNRSGRIIDIEKKQEEFTRDKDD